MFDSNTIVRHVIPGSPLMMVVRKTTEIQDGVGQDRMLICRWFDAHGVLHQDRFRYGEVSAFESEMPSRPL